MVYRVERSGFSLVGDWLHLASIFPPILSETAKLSGIQSYWRREVAGSTAALAVLQPFVCYITYIWAEYVYYTCVQEACVGVFWIFVRDWWGWTAFILFNLSLISLVWNFNSCNKSASGWGGGGYTMQAKSVWVCAFPDRCMCKCSFSLQYDFLMDAFFLCSCFSHATKALKNTNPSLLHNDMFTEWQIEFNNTCSGVNMNTSHPHPVLFS